MPETNRFDTAAFDDVTDRCEYLRIVIGQLNGAMAGLDDREQP